MTNEPHYRSMEKIHILIGSFSCFTTFSKQILSTLHIYYDAVGTNANLLLPMKMNASTA